jgi:hypothetical protein
MTGIAINGAITLLLLGLFFLTKTMAWQRIIAVLLFLQIGYLLAFGGDSLRAEADLARSQGHSFEFIEGLARMNKSAIPTDISIAIVALGLLVVCLGAMRK